MGSSNEEDVVESVAIEQTFVGQQHKSMIHSVTINSNFRPFWTVVTRTLDCDRRTTVFAPKRSSFDCATKRSVRHCPKSLFVKIGQRKKRLIRSTVNLEFGKSSNVSAYLFDQEVKGIVDILSGFGGSEEVAAELVAHTKLVQVDPRRQIIDQVALFRGEGGSSCSLVLRLNHLCVC
jgi:hypothetical protein